MECKLANRFNLMHLIWFSATHEYTSELKGVGNAAKSALKDVLYIKGGLVDLLKE